MSLLTTTLSSPKLNCGLEMHAAIHKRVPILYNFIHILYNSSRNESMESELKTVVPLGVAVGAVWVWKGPGTMAKLQYFIRAQLPCL